MKFTPRLTRPTSGNKYYITQSKNGYSSCIEGKVKSTKKPDTQCNTLSNCVGYACGRFNEEAGYGKIKYNFCMNAENFVQYAKKWGLCVGTTPKLGAIIVWQKGATLCSSDGCGHVAVVEVEKTKGTKYTISQSGWNSNVFWTEDICIGDGNWRPSWMSKDYKFIGFIYNPDIEIEEPAKPADTKIWCYNQEFTVKCICKDSTNYIRLRDCEEVLHLCGVGWFNNKVMLNGKALDMSTFSVITDNGTNYVRLRDLDEKLHLCKVIYNSTRRMPEVIV